MAEIRRRANPSQGRAVSPGSGHGRESRGPCCARSGHLGECFPNREAPDSPELLQPHKWVFSPVRGSICLLMKMIQGPLPHKTHVPPSELAPISPPGFQATSPGSHSTSQPGFARPTREAGKCTPEAARPGQLVPARAKVSTWEQRALSREPGHKAGEGRLLEGSELSGVISPGKLLHIPCLPGRCSSEDPNSTELHAHLHRRTSSQEPACAWCSERAYVSVLTPASLPAQYS